MHPKGNHGQSQKPVHIFLLYFVLFKALLLLLTGMVTSMRELRARLQTFLDCTSSYFSPYKPVQQAMQKCNGAVQTLVPTAAIQEQADPPRPAVEVSPCVCERVVDDTVLRGVVAKW